MANSSDRGDHAAAHTKPRCDCCGRDHDLTIEWSSFPHDVTKATCSFCQGLIDSGLLREEWYHEDEGVVRRFRRMTFEWREGELV